MTMEWTESDTEIVTPNFLRSELACQCGCQVPERLRPRLVLLAVQLEKIRAELKAPLLISSGYRCPARNHAVNGAPASRHMLGEAADLIVPKTEGPEIASSIMRLIGEGTILAGGVGTYADIGRRSICHYDFRGKTVRWGP
jgi:uncharacterized protein YcbK (DUF882 family)